MLLIVFLFALIAVNCSSVIDVIVDTARSYNIPNPENVRRYQEVSGSRELSTELGYTVAQGTIQMEGAEELTYYNLRALDKSWLMQISRKYRPPGKRAARTIWEVSIECKDGSETFAIRE